MNESPHGAGKGTYLITVVLFLAIGGLIGASTYVAFFPSNLRLAFKIAMVVLSLGGWLLLSRIERLQQYKQIAASFFAVSLGVLLSHYFGGVPMRLLGFTTATVQGVAMAKLGEALPIVLSILILHFATGGDLDGLFLRGGNLRFWLVASAIGVALFLGVAVLQGLGSGLEWATIVAAAPWILIFVFANAFMEELWFRALFLQKLEPLVGVTTTLVITSIVFGGIHISSTYVIDILTFVLATVVLGLIWAWLMWRSKSIWGAVLIHAAGDVLVMVGFLAGTDL